MKHLEKTLSLNIDDVIKNKNLKEVHLHDIIKAATIINSKLDLQYMLEQIISHATRLTQSSVASIILTSNTDNSLVIAHSTNSVSNIRFPKGKGVAGLCISTGKIKVVENAEKNPYHYKSIDNSTGFKTNSILCVPLTIKDQTIGCIQLINKCDNTQFSDNDIAIATMMSSFAAVSIKNAEAYERLKMTNLALKSQITSDDMVIGKNRHVRKIYESVKKLKNTASTVLILGESGTGKGVLARTIHEQSNRKEYPFITVNCSVFSQSLMESELFGHEKGAFTGADKLKKGRFELANGGTIFLDEIGELDKDVQTKLLRILQEKVFERVGGTETLTSDSRIIAATNTNLEEAIDQKLFRKDLYYRLKVIVFRLPPLRERKEDIPTYARYFLDRYRNELNKPIEKFNDESMSALQEYDYPGNIRELENIVERTVVLAENDVIHKEDLPEEIQYQKKKTNTIYSSSDTHDRSLSIPEIEKDTILSTLCKCSWNQSKASRLLGISRDQLRYRIKKYNLTK
ncbi:MAG: sigma-54-dependent Fis family transcriptional regulator [Planctomycetes bacterium]|nr:sigma-54-dependent Fis family transcriptional regulator [Planctomycetota bacterium]